MSHLDFPQDQVWVIYDRESTSKYSDALHQEALDEARKNNVNVALSNVCFEYWLLLHLKNLAPAMRDCDTLIASNAFKAAFNELEISRYEKKSSDEVAQKLMNESFLKNAKEHATNINQQTLNSSSFNETTPHKLRPYTNVHKLLEAIDKIASVE